MKAPSNELILTKILIVRDQKIMLDRDLADLYDVETKYLKRQVRRNINRFPQDFMFELTMEEIKILRCQFGTSSWGGNRYKPMVFTEQGVAQLSSVLKSDRAIQVNIQIIRLFTKMRKLLSNHQDLILKIQKIERNLDGQSHEIKVLFAYLKKLMSNKGSNQNGSKRKKIGF